MSETHFANQPLGTSPRFAQQPDASASRLLPRWWRVLVVAVSSIVLCSCKAPLARWGGGNRDAAPLPAAQHAPPGRHPSHLAHPATPHVAPVSHTTACPHCNPGPPLAPLPPNYSPLAETTYAPDRQIPIRGPWPADEYICDGGDRGLPAVVQPDWIIRGLETEDAIAHYDTLDGGLHVQPSNRVCLYAPRFAAVRSVVDPNVSEQTDWINIIHRDLPPGVNEESLPPLVGTQHTQVHADIGKKGPTIFRVRESDGVLSVALLPREFDKDLLPFENLGVIRYGTLTQADRPRLAIGRNAAIAWIADQGVQLIVEGLPAVTLTKDQKGESVHIVDTERGPAKLRVLKIADQATALPGETVHFTIRFDNVGDQVVGNVTIVDNLTARLEYVEGSAQSSVKADFLTQRNDDGSLVLRWEVTDPLPVGEGGLVRFECRVR